MAAGGVTVIGLTETLALLKKMGDQARDMRPVLGGPIQSSVHQFFRRQFASAGGVGGEPWAPLTRMTRQLKARQNLGDMGILRRTNTLWSSLVKRSGPYQIRRLLRHSLEVGTRHPAAIYAQEGWMSTSVFGRTRSNPRFVRPRTLVPENLPRSMVAAWDRLMVEYLEGRR